LTTAPTRPGSAVLALDVGTSSVKAALVVDGTVARLAEAEVPLHHPAPGWAEQDPEDWWSATRKAVQALGDVGNVDVIGVTGQMQDLVPLDAEGTPVRPALLYADQRATVEHAALAAELGASWADAAGAPPDATNVAAKWRWLQAHEPDAVRRTAVVLLGGHGAVVHRLTGLAVCDPTTAATTGLYDVRSGSWWSPVVDAVSVPLPAVQSSVTVTGPLTAAAAAALGLAPGTPVVQAAGDAVATTVGVVGEQQGTPYGYLGTSGWVGVLTAVPEPRPGVIVLPGIDGASWLSVAPVITAGSAVDWARDAWFDGIDPAAFDALAAPACAAAEGVLFLPHLDGARVPVASADGTGVLVGVRRSTSRAMVAAAVVEGVAHAIRAVATTVAPQADELLLCGGLARSALGCQVLADVLGVTVVPVADEHAALRGAASCALRALGKPGLGAAAPSARYVPRSERHAAHAAVAPLIDSLLTVLGPTFSALADARGAASRTPTSSAPT
jgi:xylulokinase